VEEVVGQVEGRRTEVREFCAQEGVTPTALAHWRKEIAARDTRRADAADPLFVPVPVRVTPLPAALLDVVLPDGRMIRVPPGFDPAHLRAVAAALEGVPC
jgi:transposase